MLWGVRKSHPRPMASRMTKKSDKTDPTATRPASGSTDAEEQSTMIVRPAPTPSRPALSTREVFVDTDPYFRLGHDLTKAPILSLFEHAAEGRLRLHITDLTLREILRQITEAAEKDVASIKVARAALNRWRARAPKAAGSKPAKLLGLDGEKIGAEAFAEFDRTLVRNGVIKHDASARPAVPIFQAYFRREPPFDGPKLKEFPDAFALDALGAWCETNDATMYVVGGDKAMRRAVEAHQRLLGIEDLQDLLAMATIAHSPNVEQAVAKIVALPAFAASLSSAIDDGIDTLEVMYWGDLAEGEASEPQRAGPPEDIDWTVISASGRSYGVIVECQVKILAQLDFEDRSMAMYDREDGVFIGAQSSNTEIEEDVPLRLFVQVDDKGAISCSEMLTHEVALRGEDEFPYH